MSNYGRKLSNGNKSGWWKLYSYDGVFQGEFEYLNINNSEYLNRTKFYDMDSNIISDKSNFFYLQTNKDTVRVNETVKITLVLDEPFFSYESESFILFPSNIDNSFDTTFSNRSNISLDTIRSVDIDPNVIKKSIPKDIPTNRTYVFGIDYLSIGIKNIRGIIVEENGKTGSKKLMRELYFNKEIVVVE